MWRGDKLVLNFTGQRGETLEDVIRNDHSLAKWMLRQDFISDEVKDAVRQTVAGSPPGELLIPARPGAALQEFGRDCHQTRGRRRFGSYSQA